MGAEAARDGQVNIEEPPRRTHRTIGGQVTTPRARPWHQASRGRWPVPAALLVPHRVQTSQTAHLEGELGPSVEREDSFAFHLFLISC